MSDRGPATGREVDGASDAAKVFEYPACPGAPPRPAWDGWIEAPGGEAEPGQQRAASLGQGRAQTQVGDAVGFSENRETRQAFEAGRKEGCAPEREAQAAARKNDEERHKRQIAKLIADLSGERDRYFQAVEEEVVKLALAIAARVLRRVAHTDPLLLMGAVRVALGQLAGSSEVTLHVPAEQYSLWTEAVALAPNLKMKPKVVAEESMRLGDCTIESQAGSADLGVRAQLGEIERGFFGRAGAREQPAQADDEAGA